MYTVCNTINNFFVVSQEAKRPILKILSIPGRIFVLCINDQGYLNRFSYTTIDFLEIWGVCLSKQRGVFITFYHIFININTLYSRNC